MGSLNPATLAFPWFKPAFSNNSARFRRVSVGSGRHSTPAGGTSLTLAGRWHPQVDGLAHTSFR